LTSSKNLRTGWLVTAGIVALYLGTIRPYEAAHGINNSRSSGLAEATEPISLWHQPNYLPQLSASRAEIADADKFVPGQIRVETMAFLAPPASSPAPQSADAERKMVRTVSIDLVVQKPAEAAERIRTLAEGLGGFLVSSQISGGSDATNGSLTIRVPAGRFEETHAAIRKLGLRVDSERTEAEDVTRQYVDQEASLRNLRVDPETSQDGEGHARSERETGPSARTDRAAASGIPGAVEAD
jgi:hypothetical protein